MLWLGFIAVVLLALLPLVVSIRRATELFVVQVREGEAIFVRGRIPPGLLADISDVVGKARVESAELRALRQSGRAELEVRGEVKGEDVQRLRNAIACYSLPRIASGARPSSSRQRGMRRA
jgi:hypothetical protein